MTAKELFELWLNSKRPFVKPSTMANYRRICFNTLLPSCNMYGLLNGCTVLEHDLQNKYSAKTTTDIISVMNQIIQFAYDQKIVSEKRRISSRPTHKTKNTQVFTAQEQRLFTQYLLSDMDYSRLGVILSLYTGLRLGEICGLQIRDVDLKSNVIHITKTLQRICDGTGHSYHYIGSPKTDCSLREIPIPDFLSSLLEKYITELSETCYITSGTEDFVQPRTYQNRFKSYLKQCNLPDYHFHTLRHTFASRAVELGFDIKSLSEILGHSNVKTTLNLYVHPSMEQKRAEMERFSALA